MTNESSASLRVSTDLTPARDPRTGISIEQMCTGVQREPSLTSVLVERLIHSTLGTMVNSKLMPGAVGFAEGKGVEGLRFDSVPLLVVRHADPRLEMERPCTALFTRRRYQQDLGTPVGGNYSDLWVDRYTEMTGGAMLWQACVGHLKFPIVIDPGRPHAVFLPHADVEQCMRIWSRSERTSHPEWSVGPTSAARFRPNVKARDRLRARVDLLLRQWSEVTRAVLYEHCEPTGHQVLTLGLCADEVSATLQSRLRRALPLIGWGLPSEFEVQLVSLHTEEELEGELRACLIYGSAAMSTSTDAPTTPLILDGATCLEVPGPTTGLQSTSVEQEPQRAAATFKSSSLEHLCEDIRTHRGLMGLLIERLIHSRLGTVVSEPSDEEDREGSESAALVARRELAGIDPVRIQLLRLSEKPARSGMAHRGKAVFTHPRYAVPSLPMQVGGRVQNLCGLNSDLVTADGGSLLRLVCQHDGERPIVIDPGQPHSVVIPCSVVAECLRLWTQAVPSEDVPDTGSFTRITPAEDERDVLQMRVGVLLRQWPQVRQAVLYHQCAADVPPTLTLGLAGTEAMAKAARRLRRALPLLTWDLPSRFRVKRLSLQGPYLVSHSRFGRPIYVKNMETSPIGGGRDGPPQSENLFTPAVPSAHALPTTASSSQTDQ